MAEYTIVEEDTKQNSFVKLLLTMIFFVTIIVAGLVFASMYFGVNFFEKGTDPQKVANLTSGKFLLEEKEYQTFDEYYDTITSNVASNTPSANDTDTPILEYETDFYNYRQEYYERCEQRTVDINFSKSKTSTLSFNYKDSIFQYNVNVFNDLYSFTDELKKQDCYFRGGSYTRGYYEDPYNEAFMKQVAKDFQSLKGKYTDDELVEIAALFVQSIEYGTDSTELNRYPYETFFEEEGNCLDKSVILTYILDELGYTSYIILGQSTQYHALVGIACEEGANIKVNDQPVCFIETTVFAPIGTSVEIDIDNTVDTSYGTKIYKGTNYGPQLVQEIEQTKVGIESITFELEQIKDNLASIQSDMCTTDCVICENGNVNFERSSSEISSCKDANFYNILVQEYNDEVNNYNDLIKDWYKGYYEIEKSMFDNRQLIKR